jgi:hypothetical protein
MAQKNRHPVYWLKLTDKNNTKHRTNAGAAWISDFNQLRIVLNPGVVLNWNDDMWITLEPIDPNKPPRLPATLRVEPPPGESSSDDGGKDDDDDDIPF